MNLFNDSPAGDSLLPEQVVYQPHRAVVWTCLAALENSCVVENHGAAWHHKLVPLFPFTADTALLVVSVDEQKVNRTIPFVNCIKAKAFNPDNIPLRNTPDQP